MKYKFFVYGDVHGHFKELKSALEKAGFDENDPKHKIIDLSDSFDRGTESLTLYEWYMSLPKDKLIVLNGNHFPFLSNYLDGTSLSPFNYQYNGVDETLADFLHETKPFETWCLFNNIELPTYGDFAKWITMAKDEINKEYPELLSWLKSLPYFYETKNYIFTHGAINGICENWKEPPEGWKQLTWATPKDFFNPIINTDKRVVVGHINCGLLRSLVGEDENDNSTFIRDDGEIIGLDTCTILSHKVNVLVIEDEILE